jgi:predicted CXXCH cytochrome family protein
LASKKGKRRRAPAPAAAASQARPRRRWSLVAGIALAVLVVIATAWWTSREPPKPAVAPLAAAPAAAVKPDFIGSAACADCHRAETAAWKTSQHARAMQHANDKTALGDFNNANFTYNGITSTFFRRDGKYWVRTDGADGKLADFEIRYTFGLYPLQQYLIEFPDGRLQALSIAWDSRPKAQGGQRWFHLYPNEKVDFRDELHWTGRQQNWNFMCADCHSINVRKNYDAASNTFKTAWSEITVGCEACHGPGSAHAAWAKTKPADPTMGLTVRLDERRGVAWTIDPATGNAARSRPNDARAEVEVCAQCHARRAQIAENYSAGKPFLDHYRPSLLAPGLYYPDGQQRDEVYIWGSFLQSKMHRAGVTCSDCHEPHSGKLRAEGNAVCAQCHLPTRYDGPKHHFHKPGAKGSACVDCHMPQTTYMVIDPRRDHSLRVPRPDQSVSLGVPNACTGCHKDKDAAWAAGVLEARLGHKPEGFQRFAGTLAAAARGDAGAGALLAALANDPSQPAIARASAAQALGGALSPQTLEALRAPLGAADPLLRLGALAALEALPDAQRLALAAPLLEDPVLAVRIEAAWLLAPVPDAAFPAAHKAAFERAAAQYEAVQRYDFDRPEARTSLGTFEARRGRSAEAEKLLRSALALEPKHVPAYVNLADLLRSRGRDAEGEAVLREGLAVMPQDATLHHVLGLTLVRLKRAEDALAELARAAALAPDDARFAYVYALGLYANKKPQQALAEIDRALARHAADRNLLLAGATISRDAGERSRALEYAQRLVQAAPQDAQAQQLLQALQAR